MGRERILLDCLDFLVANERKFTSQTQKHYNYKDYINGIIIVLYIQYNGLLSNQDTLK